MMELYPVDDETVDDAKDLADLSEGFAGEKPPVKPEKPAAAPEKPAPAETPRAEATPAPRHRRITVDEYARLSAAVDKMPGLEQQLSKAFGTIGNFQKVINELQAGTPRGGKFVIPPEAFAEMEKDFPELAQQTRATLEKALSGFTGSGTAEVDYTNIESMLAKHATTREIEALADAYPDWREIVGAVDIKTTQPDAANPFRKWLATKDATYQARINGTESARVIERAIETFRQETKRTVGPASTAADARRQQIAAAVQPRGDGAAPSAGKSDDDEFSAGFKSG
jgi:hypothetical protein